MLLCFSACIKKECKSSDGSNIILGNIFYDDFSSDRDWNFQAQQDTIGSGDTAWGTINNGKLELYAVGCIDVTAGISLAAERYPFFDKNTLTISINFQEFSSDPIISNATKISIIFAGKKLDLMPTSNFGDLGWIDWKLENEIFVPQTGGEAQILNEFIYTTIPAAEPEGIYITLQSSGPSDCSATASLSIQGISIYAQFTDCLE